MLGTRLIFGLAMVGSFVLILCLDEWLAPWFPLWFVLAMVALWTSALELVGLLNATGARASGHTVFGGVVAVMVSNWAPHLSHSLLVPPQLASRLPFDPLTPVSALGWP